MLVVKTAMKIGNIEFKNNLILAPMAGVTEVAFRSLCIECGADCGVTEMVSAKALAYGSEKTNDLLFTASNEKIKIVQIFGNDADIMANICSSKHLEKFDIIDINMGCPVPKVVNNGEGSALLNDIDKAREIIEKCVAATNKPITVKFRIGWDENSIVAVAFAKMCEEAGAAAITVHGRTRQQFYSGIANRKIISEVAKAVSIPVIGNGDVSSKEDYDEMMALGCSAVMVGRASLGNPGIFAEILCREKRDKKYYVLRHIEKLQKFFSDDFIVKHIRKHLLWYLKGVRGSSIFKTEIVRVESLSEMISRLKEYNFN